MERVIDKVLSLLLGYTWVFFLLPVSGFGGYRLYIKGMLLPEFGSDR